ncbi:hypothetical protein [Ekhidna sp.]|jgi:hypothetical protein|uniref:hypothetical protein n=1 Tax=Ekhidna sp. TaxID=2608089 RepID=UPI0032EE86C8
MGSDEKVINWVAEFGCRPVDEVYEDTLLDYKEKARQDFCNELGYEPPLKHSIVSENMYRSSLHAYDEKRITKEDLDRKFLTHSRVINQRVIRSEPDLKELALKYETKNPYWK